MSTENTPQRPSGLFRLLELSGGSFLSLAVFLVELISFPIVAVGLLITQVNARFTPEDLTITAGWGAILLCLGDIFY